MRRRERNRDDGRRKQRLSFQRKRTGPSRCFDHPGERFHPKMYSSEVNSTSQLLLMGCKKRIGSFLMRSLSQEHLENMTPKNGGLNFPPASGGVKNILPQ